MGTALDLGWITPSFPSGELTGAGDSSLASERYRMLLPGRELATRGHRVRIIHCGEPGSATLPAIAIFGKLSNSDAKLLASQIRANLDWAVAAKASGTRIVADFCDNHFGDPLRGDYSRALLGLADLLVTSTAVIGEMLTAQTATPVRVIPDPVEGPGGAPRFAAAQQQSGLLSRLFAKSSAPATLKLLWFGHQSGLRAMQSFIPELETIAPATPLTLEIVCAPGFGGEDIAAALNKKGIVSAAFTPWSRQATWSAFERCDMVVLPAMPSEASRSAKSANRLTEALWAGRYVLAHSLPSYEEYTECAWVSEDLTTGLRWAIRNPELALAQIENGQRRIRERLLPAAVAKLWETSLQELSLGEARSANVTHVAAPASAIALASTIAPAMSVKLNLGCGDKILPGYLNVDVASSRNGAQPDVLCDLHDLSVFASGSADEILSVHVVEHFWRWEVDAILAEWVRVLKRGGRMVIECPNLAAACEALLANPDVGPGPEGNRSLWVLYGDPAWQDPLMCHRWGYTPQTLAALLRIAGLKDVRQEPAQFKMREPRDMRIVGVKP